MAALGTFRGGGLGETRGAWGHAGVVGTRRAGGALQNRADMRRNGKRERRGRGMRKKEPGKREERAEPRGAARPEVLVESEGSQPAPGRPHGGFGVQRSLPHFRENPSTPLSLVAAPVPALPVGVRPSANPRAPPPNSPTAGAPRPLSPPNGVPQRCSPRSRIHPAEGRGGWSLEGLQENSPSGSRCP